MKNREDYIGCKVRGFKFETTPSVRYAPRMDDFVGRVGVVSKYTLIPDAYLINFGDDSWCYPAKGVLENIIGTPEELPDRAPEGITLQAGLTKREWFAGLAMQGMLANTNGFGTYGGHTTSENVNQKAVFCIAMADALIEALNKEEK